MGNTSTSQNIQNDQNCKILLDKATQNQLQLQKTLQDYKNQLAKVNENLNCFSKIDQERKRLLSYYNNNCSTKCASAVKKKYGSKIVDTQNTVKNELLKEINIDENIQKGGTNFMDDEYYKRKYIKYKTKYLNYKNKEFNV